MPKRKTELKSFTVERSSWMRGTSRGLLRGLNGLMCCLGFYCLAAGCSEDDIEEMEYPSDVGIEFYRQAHIAQVNDDTEIDDCEREAKLTERFGKAGIEVKFVD